MGSPVKKLPPTFPTNTIFRKTAGQKLLSIGNWVFGFVDDAIVVQLPENEENFQYSQYKSDKSDIKKKRLLY